MKLYAILRRKRGGAFNKLKLCIMNPDTLGKVTNDLEDAERQLASIVRPHGEYYQYTIVTFEGEEKV